MEQASISIARTKDADVLVLARGRQQAAIAVPRQVGEQASVHGRQLEQLGASGLDVEDLDGLVGGARDHDAARQRMPIGRDQTLVARLHADGRLVRNKKAWASRDGCMIEIESVTRERERVITRYAP